MNLDINLFLCFIFELKKKFKFTLSGVQDREKFVPILGEHKSLVQLTANCLH